MLSFTPQQTCDRARFPKAHRVGAKRVNKPPVRNMAPQGNPAPHRPSTKVRATSPKTHDVCSPVDSQYNKTGQPFNDTLEHTLSELPRVLSEAVAGVTVPLQQVLSLAQTVIKKKEPTRLQKIAAVINRWALPVMQVMLGAAILTVGVHTMDISIMVLGAMTCATGLAVCITLVAGLLAHHPLDDLDEVKKFAKPEFLRNLKKRRQPRDPDFYKPGMTVALDGGP